MDDASVPEIAKRLSHNPDRSKRGILFVIFTAEEKGLLGSRYFARHPTVPAQQLVADLNMDILMPLFPLKKLQVQGLAESTLQEDARAVGAQHHVEIATDPEPDRNSFVRTGQYSFVQVGVPALAMGIIYLTDRARESNLTTWKPRRHFSKLSSSSQTMRIAASS